MAKIETRAQFARRIGRDRSSVTRMAQKGLLVLTDAGHVDVEPSLARLAASGGLRPDVAERNAANRAQNGRNGAFGPGGAATPPPPVQFSAPERPEGVDGGPPGRALFKAIALNAENQLILLERQIRTGARIELPALRDAAETLGGQFRASLERLIDYSAPLLALQDPAARAAALAAACGKERRRLRHALRRAQLRLGRGGG